MRLLICLTLAFLFACKEQPPRLVAPPVVKLSHRNFIFVGDTGTGEDGQYAVARGMEQHCAQHGCDFGVLLGDNIYPSGVKSVSDAQWRDKFEKPYEGLPFKFYAALGNHDHYGEWRAQVDYKSARWSMPDRYYVLDLGKEATIVVLDTHVMDEAQAQWLDRVLDGDESELLIVVGHHPIYSEGSHGDTGYLKESILPILKDHGVDLYLAGHDHDLQVIHRQGVDFVVAGSGAKLRGTRKGPYSLFAVSKLGFGYLDLDERKFELYDAKARLLYQKSI